VTTEPVPGPPASRVFSWLVACLLVGWLVVYNLLRIGGDSPEQAALPSLLIGAVCGLAVFGLGMLVLRRLHASGRRLLVPPSDIPSPSAMDQEQRDAVRLTWAPLAALAAVAIAMGLWIGADWISTDPDQRGYGTALLAAWNLLAGLWLGDEAIRLRRGEAEGIESIVLGCTLTAVLAGVGISRDLAVPGQVALIILAGIAGALVGLAVWRFHGARGLPAGSIGVLVVAALSLLLPYVL
jgi:peptidoglycan/LPS O-acetylase OafA/YrhL